MAANRPASPTAEQKSPPLRLNPSKQDARWGVSLLPYYHFNKGDYSLLYYSLRRFARTL